MKLLCTTDQERVAKVGWIDPWARPEADCAKKDSRAIVRAGLGWGWCPRSELEVEVEKRA